MKKITFHKPGTMLSPLPVVMVSCGESPDEYNIITVAWTGTVNSDPPMVSVSIRASRHSHPIIKRTGEFVINLTTEDLARVTDWCGVKSGRDVNKFQETGLTPMPAGIVSCPLVGESPVNLECRVRQVLSLGSHDLFLAEVVAVHGAEELLDGKGKLDLAKARLITYSHGAYYGVKSKPLGVFGWSVMKPGTKKRIARERRMQRNGSMSKKRK